MYKSAGRELFSLLSDCFEHLLSYYKSIVSSCSFEQNIRRNISLTILRKKVLDCEQSNLKSCSKNVY